MKKIILALFAGLALVACENIEPSEETSEDIEDRELVVSHNYGSGARACLIEAMYFEARGTGYRGLRAVGEVILNRSDSSRWPSGACAVLNQRYNGSCQFSFKCDGIPENYHEPAERAKAAEIADELLNNRQQDITGGATFFHAQTMAPGWFNTLNRIGKFGGNIFYK